MSNGFTFLKQRLILTNTGKVIQIPCKDNVVRERRKLKKLHKKYINNKVQLSDIEESYKSWRGSIMKYNSYHVIRNMDRLYYKLFGGGR